MAINDWMDKCQLISPHHHGGRRNFSTATAKTSLDLALAKNLDLRCHSAVLATDLSAAFDTVDHVTLLRKLEWHGIRGRELDLFESYLSNRLQFVEIDTFRSNILHSLACSSIQGSRFAGTLYNLYGLEIPLIHKIILEPHLLKAFLSLHQLRFLM